MTYSSPANVLVVEDDPVQAVFLQVELSDQGYAVIGPASRVEQALQLVADNQLTAAVLDVDVSGYSIEPVADALQRRKVPFVFLAVRVPRLLRSKFQEAPVMLKPFDPGRLNRLVAELIESRNAGGAGA